jgi:predicted RNA-binding Zn ribbon-like protein
VALAGYHPGSLSDFTFDLDAGRVCLDFANTRDSSADHLTAYSDLVAFAAQSRLLTREDAEWLRAEGFRDLLRAEGVVLRAHRLREAIYAMFSAQAAGSRPREYDVDQLNFELAATLTHARVLPVGGRDVGGREVGGRDAGYRWGWVGRNMDAPLWGISRSAADLLTDDMDMRRVRECGGADCRWLFLDTSKNRSRQWCSMQSCGNREKARRHYARNRTATRAAESGPS